MTKSGEIHCFACGADTFVLKEPEYDGLKKVGDTYKCASCGHLFPSEEEVPYKGKKTVQVFTDADRSADIHLFDDSEAEQLCRHCTNYVINPFMQWCALHKKEVEATDTCSQFERAPEKEEEAE